MPPPIPPGAPPPSGRPGWGASAGFAAPPAEPAPADEPPPIEWHRAQLAANTRLPAACGPLSAFASSVDLLRLHPADTPIRPAIAIPTNTQRGTFILGTSVKWPAFVQGDRHNTDRKRTR